MEGNQLQRQATHMRRTLFDQGYLDEQFIQLEELQDDANPNFVEEVVRVFYNDSARLIRNIEMAMGKNPIDFGKLDDVMHQFKGSCSGIGAKKVKRECTRFQDYCKEEDLEGCMGAFQAVKQEHATLKGKLDAYFQAMLKVSPTPSRTGQLDKDMAPVASFPNIATMTSK